MESVVAKLSNDLAKLAEVTVCGECGAVQDVRRLSNCQHLVCLKCLYSSASKCPVCNIPFTNKEETKDDHLEDFITNIHGLNGIIKDVTSKTLSFGNSTIVPLFSPESTINKRNHKGETRLHKDCRNGQMDNVKCLLETGIDVNVQDFAGWTALHEAVSSQKVDVVRLLLQHEALVNVPGHNYDTPLHTAIQERNITIIKLLVEYGALLTCYNRNGKTPLDLASNSTNITTTLCLTQRRPYLLKCYTIPRPKVFFLNVSKEDTDKLSGVTVSTQIIADNVTYVVLGNENPDAKQLQAAMLRGCCIVTTKWIDDFMSKSLFNPLDYVPDIEGYDLKGAVGNTFNKLPKLFDGLRFYFCHKEMQVILGYPYTMDDLKKLVAVGGGTVLVRRPTRVEEHDIYYPYHAKKNSNLATTTYYMIYNEGKVVTIEQSSAGMRYKSSKWLIECINSFSIIP